MGIMKENLINQPINQPIINQSVDKQKDLLSFQRRSKSAETFLTIPCISMKGEQHKGFILYKDFYFTKNTYCT